MLEAELSPAGGASQVGLVLYPLVEALLVELVLAVQLGDNRLFRQVLKAKAAVIVLVLVRGLVGDVPEELPLHQLLYLDFELEPREGVGRRNMVVPPAIVDHHGYDGGLDDDEQNDDEEGD